MAMWRTVCDRRRPDWRAAALVVGLLLTPLAAPAQDFVVGRESSLRISVAPSSSEPCNVEILLPEGTRLERELLPPHFETTIGYTPRSDGPQTIVWEGRFRFKGSLSVSGCNGRYFRDVVVRPGSELTRERWDNFLAGMTPRQRECVEFGTGRAALAGTPAPRLRAASPDDPSVRTVAAACERFVNLPLRTDVPCAVSRSDKRQTRCEDQYLVGSGRKARVLDAEAAMRAVANGAQIRVALREPEAVRASRLEAEKALREKAAAEEAARRKAEEAALAEAADAERRKAEAEAKAIEDAEKAKLAEIARVKRLRCFAGRCFDLGF
ncbi:MAG: hypothetical protein FGM40_06465 [Rhodocyclaceae bacterium]|nr:hypothetical protein [Rhodocyclaceae bacterium]